jgi:thymidylate synthase (FAD)
MKIVQPSVEIMRTGLETEFMTPEQFIEKVGRTCYKSEDKITDTSAATFVSNLIKRGHEAMIEHWNLICKVDVFTYMHISRDWNDLLHNKKIPVKQRLRPYLRFTSGDRSIISGNMRAWRDYLSAFLEYYGRVPEYMYGLVRNYPLFFPEYQDYIPPIIVNDILIPIDVIELDESERRIHQDVTVKFVCDRGVSHEMVRHRVASFAQESTRYCNYSNDKFGNEITVVRPSWCGVDSAVFQQWEAGCERAEASYFALLDKGAAPQEARSVLPNSTKTEIIVTMNLDGWDHFFSLRCAANAQPDMREVALMAQCMLDQCLNPNIYILDEVHNQ